MFLWTPRRQTSRLWTSQLISGNNTMAVSFINSFRCITCTCKVVPTIARSVRIFEIHTNFSHVLMTIPISSYFKKVISASYFKQVLSAEKRLEKKDRNKDYLNIL